MRKREVVSVRWEVRDADGRPKVTTWGDAGKARAWRSVRAAARRGEARTVHRITRYRLAPLVEVSGWRKANRQWSASTVDTCGDDMAGAVTYRGDRYAAWAPGKGEADIRIEGDGARPEAEAALRLLGFRVAK